MNPLIKKLASQTAVYGLSTIVGRLFFYLLTPIYTRIFAPAQYGIITEMYAYVSILNVIFTMGMETAFFRYFTLKQNKQDVFNAAFSLLLFTTIIFTALLWLATPYIAQITRYTSHPEYIYWFIGIIALETLSAIPFALLRVNNHSKAFATIKLMNISINFFLNIFFLVICPLALHHHWVVNIINSIYNPAIGVGYVFIANLCASGITLVCFSGILSRVSLRIDMQLLREMLHYGLPLIIIGLAGMVNETMDRLLLKYNLPGTSAYVMGQVGIYGANYRLSILLTLFVQAFRMAAEPFFFSQAAETDSRKQYATIMNYFVALCCGIFLLVTLYLPEFKYFIGKSYYSGLRIVPILLLANLFLGIYYNLSIWYKLTHKNTQGALVAIAGAVITLVINFLFIPKYSYTASAWATFICYGSMMVISYTQGQKHFPVPYDLKKLGICFIASLLIFGINNWALQPLLLNNYLQVISSTLLFALYVYVIYVLFKGSLYKLKPNI